MTTSHSDYSDALPEGAGGERQELVPALSSETQERDPTLIELVRNLAALEMRLSHLPTRPTTEGDDEIAGIIDEMGAAELGLRHYAEELAVSKKVDRYTAMLSYLERQRDALVLEVKRLSARKRAAETIIERMLGAAHYALSMLPKPRYGPRTLDGTQSSLVLVRNPGRVVVHDHAAVPTIWRQATIKINLQLWYDLLNALPQEFHERLRDQFTLTDDVVLSVVAQSLKTGLAVAGVEWKQDHRVERR